MFCKICKFKSSTRTNDVIMTLLPKTMAKFGPPRNKTNSILFLRSNKIQNKFYIVLNSIDESYPKMYIFIEFEQLCQKLWAFLSNFGLFCDASSTNMAMSRDPRRNFIFFYFVPILH